MTTRIIKAFVIRDEGQGTWHNLFEAPGIDGQPVRALVLREVQTPGKVKAALLNAGAALGDDDEGAIRAAIRQNAPIVHRRAQVGWLPRGAAFVSILHTAKHPTTTTAYQAPQNAGSAVSASLELRGTLQGWKDMVSVASHSTGMIVSLCATFAAPLLNLVNQQNFGLAFVGDSRFGKTAAQTVGASAQGYGRGQDLPTLNATPAGLSALAVATSDHALFIDEIGTARGPKKDIYVAVNDATYALMSGRDVLRHPSWAAAGSTAPSTFRTIVVISSEHSPDTWAARNGDVRDAGETARLITLPLRVLGPSIFDSPPTSLTDSDFRSWQDDQLARLHEGLPRQRGVAFGEYLDAITRNPKATANRARELIACFRKGMEQAGTSAIARDIIGKFGVLFAGGVIAAEHGILPFQPRTIGSKVKKACLAALNALPDPEANLKRNLAVLEARLQGAGIVDVSHADDRVINRLGQADGFTRRHDQGREWVIRAQTFTRWFATPADTRQVLDYLAEEGYLQQGRSATPGRSNAWAQHQTRWPDGTRPRSITVFLPRGVEDLAIGLALPA